jgi:hypothetical protein
VETQTKRYLKLNIMIISYNHMIVMISNDKLTKKNIIEDQYLQFCAD